MFSLHFATIFYAGNLRFLCCKPTVSTLSHRIDNLHSFQTAISCRSLPSSLINKYRVLLLLLSQSHPHRRVVGINSSLQLSRRSSVVLITTLSTHTSHIFFSLRTLAGEENPEFPVALTCLPVTGSPGLSWNPRLARLPLSTLAVRFQHVDLIGLW